MKVRILHAPVITEKTIELANTRNTYTFFVDRTANKNQIKQAVEQLYDVSIERINTVIVPSKIKRTGRKRLTSKVQAPRKKALVTLKSGQTIDLFDITGQGAE